MTLPMRYSRFRSILTANSCTKSFSKVSIRSPSWRLHSKGADVQTFFRGTTLRRSYHDRARGYLAGLHSYQPNRQDEIESEKAEFESFESAWEAIQSVPEDLLKDFEDELWETQSKRFVYGSKEVSVIDAVVETEEPNHSQDKKDSDQNAKVVRYLVWNERPNLIQTAVEVPHIGAPYRHYFYDKTHTPQLVARPPSPISQTHLGGLAAVLPFWNRANANASNKDPNAPPRPVGSPNCLLIGAGGCSLAHTLAANLFLDEYKQHDESETKSKSNKNNPQLTAVEASSEIMHASMLWFGAKQNDEQKSVAKKDTNDSPEPPFFHLVHSTGEMYLESLVKCTNSSSSPIDILIIDAEDGSAPPQSMRSSTFWKELVLPSLNVDGFPIVGVNSIGTKSETSELVRTMQEAFRGDGNASGLNYNMLIVAPPPEAKVSDRHNLIFALPRKKNLSNHVVNWCLSEDDLKDHVDAPDAWKNQIDLALQQTVRE